MNEKCKDCKFFHEMIIQGGAQCRRNAPVTFPVADARGLQFLSTWPGTKRDDWCGEFESEGLLEVEQ